MFKTFNMAKAKKGFTLIELLVVIAIIGILASIVLVSLNSARAKGRDAKRVAELSQIARAIALEDTGAAVTFVGCAAQNTKVSSCTTPAGLGSFSDPSGGTATACSGTAAPSAGTWCDYSVAVANGGTGTPTTANWRVIAYLESGAGTLGAGKVCISSATSTPFSAGCL